jgi:hypothetical protein
VLGEIVTVVKGTSEDMIGPDVCFSNGKPKSKIREL